MKLLIDYDVALEILERLDRNENRFEDLRDNGDVVTLYLEGPEDDAEGKAMIYDFEKVHLNKQTGKPLRKCVVDGKPNEVFLFHTWYTKSSVIEPSPMIGGHPGGTVSYLLAVLENEKTGQVIEAFAGTVKFLNEQEDAKHSVWVHEGRPIHCKRCGYTPNYPLTKDNSSFCSNCGAKMDGDK